MGFLWLDLPSMEQWTSTPLSGFTAVLANGCASVRVSCRCVGNKSPQVERSRQNSCARTSSHQQHHTAEFAIIVFGASISRGHTHTHTHNISHGYAVPADDQRGLLTNGRHEIRGRLATWTTCCCLVSLPAVTRCHCRHQKYESASKSTSMFSSLSHCCSKRPVVEALLQLLFKGAHPA